MKNSTKLTLLKISSALPFIIYFISCLVIKNNIELSMWEYVGVCFGLGLLCMTIAFHLREKVEKIEKK